MKHIVFKELASTASEVSLQKDLRNRMSYMNETNFIEALVPSLEQTGNFYFPQTYKVLHQHDKDVEKESVETFTFFTDSLTPFAEQHAVFTSPQLLSVLAWIARLHALYHGTVDLPLRGLETTSQTQTQTQTQIESQTQIEQEDFVGALAQREGWGLWSQGTHLAWEKRPSAEIQRLAAHWAELCAAFDWPDLAAVGPRLAAVAPFVSRQLSVANDRNKGRTTVVHGDVSDHYLLILLACCYSIVSASSLASILSSVDR